MYYREQLEAIGRSLDELLNDLTDEIRRLPEGSLYVYEKKGKRYYCQRLNKEGNRKKEHRVSINGDTERIFSLARKKYVESAIVNVRRDIEELNKTIDSYLPVGEEAVMEPFCAKYPELTRGIRYGKEDPREWVTDHVPAADFYEENLKSVSAQGERMRSGGEMYIASRLDHYGIPYRYESPLSFPDVDFYPDFTIMRPRDRKLFYWEHFGKVNDTDYINKNIGKVQDYIDYGIRPWDNLVITFNNEKGGFNGKMIDAIIECRLL